MKTYPEIGTYSSAAALYAGILAAASMAPDDDFPCLLPERGPVGADVVHDFCTVETVREWIGGGYRARLADDLSATSQRMASVHGPQRQIAYRSKARFRFSAAGSLSSMTVRGTRTRLIDLAETVRKGWALFGGGPKPAELTKPRAPRRATAWPMTIVRVWLAQLEDGDYAGALITGERIGARFYPGAKGETFLLAAPEAVDGLPPELVSVIRGDGRFVVSELRGGYAIEPRGYSSRKAAEAAALKTWDTADDEKRAYGVRKFANCTPADQDAARAEFCRALGLDDPADTVAEEAQDAAPEPVATTAAADATARPWTDEDHARAAAAVVVNARAKGMSAHEVSGEEFDRLVTDLAARAALADARAAARAAGRVAAPGAPLAGVIDKASAASQASPAPAPLPRGVMENATVPAAAIIKAAFTGGLRGMVTELSSELAIASRGKQRGDSHRAAALRDRIDAVNVAIGAREAAASANAACALLAA